MRSAQVKKTTHKKRKLLKGGSLALFLVVAVFVWLVLPTHLPKQDRYALIAAEPKTDAHIVVIDTKALTITDVVIPATTHVSVGQNLGTWPLASVYELGEGTPGVLVKDTITKTFGLPIDGWVNGPHNKILTIPSLFMHFETNLTVKDRIHLVLRTVFTRYTYSTLNLKDTSYLRQSTFTSGDTGYEPVGALPISIAHLFVLPEFSQGQQTVGIMHPVGADEEVEMASQVIERLGSKVVSIEEIDDDTAGCSILVKEKTRSSLVLANVFGCPISVEKELHVDIALRIGSAFLMRF